MFGQAMQESSNLTWVLRLAGFLAMFVGLILLFQPIVAFAKVVPFLGDLLTATAEQRTRYGRNGIYDVTVHGADGRVIAEFRGRSRTLEENQ